MPQESVDAMFSRRRHGDTAAIRTAALEDILALYYASDTSTQVRHSIQALLRATDGISLVKECADDIAGAIAF